MTMQDLRAWGLKSQRESMHALIAMKPGRVAPWTGNMVWNNEVALDVNADPQRTWYMHGIPVPSESVLVTIWMEPLWREIAIVSPAGVEWVMGSRFEDLTHVLPDLTE